MKHLFSKAAIVMSLACTASFLHAQTPSIVYGRTTIQLNAAFASSFQGAVITDLNANPLINNMFTVEATGGALDLQTGAGEVEHKGGLLVNAGDGVVIRIQNFILDSTSPAAPVVTALFILNDHFGVRLPLFTLQGAPGTTLPLKTQSGVLQENNSTLYLAPATASALNAYFKDQVAQPGVLVGTANLYAVLSPVN